MAEQCCFEEPAEKIKKKSMDTFPLGEAPNETVQPVQDFKLRHDNFDGNYRTDNSTIPSAGQHAMFVNGIGMATMNEPKGPEMAVVQTSTGAFEKTDNQAKVIEERAEAIQKPIDVQDQFKGPEDIEIKNPLVYNAFETNDCTNNLTKSECDSLIESGNLQRDDDRKSKLSQKTTKRTKGAEKKTKGKVDKVKKEPPLPIAPTTVAPNVVADPVKDLEKLFKTATSEFYKTCRNKKFIKSEYVDNFIKGFKEDIKNYKKAHSKRGKRSHYKTKKQAAAAATSTVPIKPPSKDDDDVKEQFGHRYKFDGFHDGIPFLSNANPAVEEIENIFIGVLANEIEDEIITDKGHQEHIKELDRTLKKNLAECEAKAILQVQKVFKTEKGPFDDLYFKKTNAKTY